MKLLVCGGAGFIGSNFIRHMLGKYPDYKVVNYDKLTYAGNLDNLRDMELDPKYKFVKGDICDLERLDEVIKRNKITHIINFAAETHVDRSIHGGAKEFVMTNSLGVQMLLDVARLNGIQKMIPYFIFKAIAGEKVPVYGDGLNVRDWIHVLDHAKALDLILHKGIPGEIYNIGSDNETGLEGRLS